MGNARNLGSLLNTSATIQADDLDIGQLGNRNLIINGAMQVAQRGTSVSGVTSGGYYTVDRFSYSDGAGATVTLSQSTDAPDEFSYSLKLEVTTADTDLSGGVQYNTFVTKLEGQNLQHLKYGTSSAKSLTLSFWVKSSLTGTFASELEISGGVNVQTFTINSADTWEYKTITFAGNTSNSIPNTSSTGMWVSPVWFAAGDGISGPSFQSGWRALNQTERLPDNIPNLLATVGNTIQITGVQLEVGDTATPFEHRSYGQELALCQRYYQRQFPARGVGVVGSSGTQVARVKSPLICTMRASPTVTTSGSINFYDGSGVTGFSSFSQIWTTPDLFEFDAILTGTLAADGRSAMAYNMATSGAGTLSPSGFILDAEL